MLNFVRRVSSGMRSVLTADSRRGLVLLEVLVVVTAAIVACASVA
jgi:hypothetical protein